jgi:hypothetical protein
LERRYLIGPGPDLMKLKLNIETAYTVRLDWTDRAADQSL